MITLFDKLGVKMLVGMGMAMFYSVLFLGIGYVEGMEVVDTETLLLHLGVANLLGIVFALSSLVFEKEEWDILKQTTIHFFILLISYVPVAVWIGWVPKHVVPIIICIGIFIIVYFIIWFIMTMYWKRKIAELNSVLK